MVYLLLVDIINLRHHIQTVNMATNDVCSVTRHVCVGGWPLKSKPALHKYVDMSVGIDDCKIVDTRFLFLVRSR